MRPTITRDALASWVRSADGTNLFARSRGRGTPMLLSNGLYCSTHYLESFAAHFADRFRVVEWDYRGHGRSNEPASAARVAIEQLADDAARVLDAHGDEPAVLVGHSMGVRVALEVYRARPERVAALVLICGSFCDAVGPLLSRRVPISALVFAVQAFAKNPLAPLVKNAVVDTELLPLVGRVLGAVNERTPREPVDRMLENIRSLDKRVMVELATSYLRHSSWDELPAIRVPTLVVAGEADPLASIAHCRRAVTRLPRGELFVLPGCTHLAPVEDPAALHAAAGEFLSRNLPSLAETRGQAAAV